MTLKEVSYLYSMKNLSIGDLKKHKYMRTYMVGDRDGSKYVGYLPEDEKSKKSFYNVVVAHSKQIPNPQKYSVIRDWAKEGKKSALPQTAKISVFTEVAQKAKKTPGPATYKTAEAIDKFVLKRTPVICKQSLEKVSITASQ